MLWLFSNTNKVLGSNPNNLLRIVFWFIKTHKYKIIKLYISFYLIMAYGILCNWRILKISNFYLCSLKNTCTKLYPLHVTKMAYIVPEIHIKILQIRGVTILAWKSKTHTNTSARVHIHARHMAEWLNSETHIEIKIWLYYTSFNFSSCINVL